MRLALKSHTTKPIKTTRPRIRNENRLRCRRQHIAQQQADELRDGALFAVGTVCQPAALIISADGQKTKRSSGGERLYWRTEVWTDALSCDRTYHFCGH